MILQVPTVKLSGGVLFCLNKYLFSLRDYLDVSSQTSQFFQIAVASIHFDVYGHWFYDEAPVEQMCLGASCDNTSTVLKATTGC